MRKVLILFVLIFSLVGCGQEAPKKNPPTKGTVHYTQSPKKVDYVVYTTRTGECYHRAGCASLRQSCFETTRNTAISNGYRACKNCVP